MGKKLKAYLYGVFILITVQSLIDVNVNRFRIGKLSLIARKGAQVRYIPTCWRRNGKNCLKREAVANFLIAESGYLCSEKILPMAEKIKKL